MTIQQRIDAIAVLEKLLQHSLPNETQVEIVSKLHQLIKGL